MHRSSYITNKMLRIATHIHLVWSVCVYVCVLDTVMSPAEIAVPVEMMCGLWTRSAQRAMWGPDFSSGTDTWGVIDLSVVIFLTFFWGGISSAASGYRYCSSL